MKAVLAVAAVVPVLARALPLVRAQDWWIRVFDFPTRQIAAALFVILVGYFIYYNATNVLDHLMVLALLLSLAYRLYRIVPYTPLVAQPLVAGPCEPTSRVRLLIANVLMDNRRAGGDHRNTGGAPASTPAAPPGQDDHGP